MSYTGDPASSDKDHVRFLVGDTNEDDELLQDAEIAHLLSDRDNVFKAAAAAAEAIAAKFSRRVDTDVSKAGIKYSQLQDHYRKLATELRLRAPLAGTLGYRDTDKSGDETHPLFQREGFGEDYVNWDD